MTKLNFYNGLREIGGTFVEVETDTTKCMFDFGFGVVDRLDDKVSKRKENVAADYIALGMLTPANGIYDEYTAEKMGLLPYGKTDKECFFVISHMHIDHMGGLGMLHPDVPVYMSKDSERLYRKLVENNDIQDRAHDKCIGIPYDETFTVGDIQVKVVQIDHDVIGACGFLITTPEGTVCYTGDYRFHGYHKDITEKFAQTAKGADVLITEGVTVSFADVDMLSITEPTEGGRSEEQLLEEVKEFVTTEKGLLVINPYNRNVERLHHLNVLLQENGKTLLFDEVAADYVSEFFPEDKISVYKNVLTEKFDDAKHNWNMVDTNMLLENPDQYVLQLDYANMYELIDLKKVVSAYFHMDGAPLGDYDPSFRKMKSLLEVLEISYEYKGTGGHSNPFGLKHMVDTIAPDTLIPLHSFRPEQVNSDCIKQMILTKYGESVILNK